MSKPHTTRKGSQYEGTVPVLRDRALQACVVNALEPEWEARFEPRSYGFRPGRGCHDAIEAIYWTLNGRNAKRQWILDADLTAAFDRIDHDHLLDSVGTFPARELIRGWLKAGVVERGRFAPSEEGTPQGGVVSPLLLNIALHGMEAAAGVRYYKLGTIGAQLVVADPGCGLHPMQGDIQKQRADYPALRGALLGRGEPAPLDHACLQPSPDEFPGWERSDAVSHSPSGCISA